MPQLELAHADDGYFAFNGNKGFVIISREDVSRAVIGYSETGTFKYESVPEGLKLLLNSIVIIKSPWEHAYEGCLGYAINPGGTETVEIPFTPRYAGEYEILIRIYNWGYKQIGQSTVTITEQSADISDVNKNKQLKAQAIWTIGGQKGQRRGLNIVRYDDGTIRKVITK